MTFKDEVEKIVETLLVRPLNTPGAVAETNKLTQALTDLHESEVRKARIDDLERLQESFGERGIVTFDMSYDEEAEAVAIANVLNKITDRIKALTTNTGGQE